MSDIVYPNLDENAIRIVARLSSLNKDYLKNPQCPYTEATKDVFLKQKATATEGSTNSEELNSDALLSSLLKLKRELEEFGRNLEGGNSSEKNTYFRLSVGLLKDLIEIKEKLVDIKNFELFSNKILTILDEICTADQRSEIRNKLEEFKNYDGEPTSNN